MFNLIIMALIKWSGLVSEVKGKLNGTIFSNPTYGAQARNRKSCKGHNSAVWSVSKGYLGLVASAWKNLTSAEYDTWEAQRINYPYVNKFGDVVTPSAYQLFCTLNLNLLHSMESMITAAVAPEAEVDISPFTVYEGAGGEILVDWTAAGGGIGNLLIYSSPPQSKGVFRQPNKMRLIEVRGLASGTPFDLTSAVEAAWGEVTPGLKYFFSGEIVHDTTGQRYGNYLADFVYA